jgi:hypothetical protein
MKKFSSITGQKVGQEPKVEVKQITEEDVFKSKVMSLMDDFLTIRTYGPVDRYLRAGSIKVAGKEEFLEALLHLVSEKSAKDQYKILESLKSNVSDWKAIDDKKNEVKSNITEPTSKDAKSISFLIETYGDDEETLKVISEKRANSLSIERATEKALIAREMAKSSKLASKLEIIAEAFENRSKSSN